MMMQTMTTTYARVVSQQYLSEIRQWLPKKKHCGWKPSCNNNMKQNRFCYSMNTMLQYRRRTNDIKFDSTNGRLCFSHCFVPQWYSDESFKKNRPSKSTRYLHRRLPVYHNDDWISSDRTDTRWTLGVTTRTNTDMENTGTPKNYHNNSYNPQLQPQLQPVSIIKRIRIFGGGLAGLSVAYHLLSLSLLRQSPTNYFTCDITMYDTNPIIGTGGASAIAGGYVGLNYFFGNVLIWLRFNVFCYASIACCWFVGIKLFSFGLSMKIKYICYSWFWT